MDSYFVGDGSILGLRLLATHLMHYEGLYGHYRWKPNYRET
jgi:hypothetical protein